MTYLIVSFCFIGFDIVTGLLKAIYKGKVNSTVLREGLFHKISELLVVFGSGALEYGTAYIKLGIDLPLIEAVTVYICLIELASIIENLCELNPKLAKLFKPYLEKIQKMDDEKGGKDE
jgi:toxin secretion/phage lysis holin